jgi:hypothetical protein
VRVALQWRHPSTAAQTAETLVQVMPTLALSYVSPII